MIQTARFHEALEPNEAWRYIYGHELGSPQIADPSEWFIKQKLKKINPATPKREIKRLRPSLW